MISAGVAVIALGSAEMVLNSTGQVVVLSAVSALDGVTPKVKEGFINACPSSGLYFVHYRLRARRNDANNASPCIMSLFVGSDVIKVRSSMERCSCRRYTEKRVMILNN